MSEEIKSAITRLMSAEALPQLCTNVFLSQYDRLVSGETSVIREEEILPVEQVDDLETLPDFCDKGREVLSQTVTLKLNGGLGTGMGLERAKSLLPAKEGLSFLEIIIRQVLSQRKSFKSELPLVFMNSFSTEVDTRGVLNKFSEILDGQLGIPLTFLQNKVPKILAESLEPAAWPEDPAKVWCPPGHGDIYTALQTTGILDQLLSEGIKYAFISNSDNLGASLDLSVLGYFAHKDVSFMMEVADRTAADKKGGHLAQYKDGQLILRESAQCHEDDSDSFQDINTHKYFNTNNLWIRLDRLKQQLDAHNGMLNLPLLQNSKTIDPRDSNSPKVIQLETAMGAAIASFNDSIALRVSKTRFAPIKTTSELLGLWSNAFVLNEQNLIVKNPKRSKGHIVISLDGDYFKKIDDFQARFPDGVPDLLDCDSLHVEGDIKFEAGVKISGAVKLVNKEKVQQVITAGTVLKA